MTGDRWSVLVALATIVGGIVTALVTAVWGPAVVERIRSRAATQRHPDDGWQAAVQALRDQVEAGRQESQELRREVDGLEHELRDVKSKLEAEKGERRRLLDVIQRQSEALRGRDQRIAQLVAVLVAAKLTVPEPDPAWQETRRPDWRST